mmetsp:Transcript_22559/g.64907  ORF Transcript_22559/g.64907 Transcript_22559/m.64907 type:complete len:113 (-) Transcript_22559:426-764(-)
MLPKNERSSSVSSVLLGRVAARWRRAACGDPSCSDIAPERVGCGGYEDDVRDILAISLFTTWMLGLLDLSSQSLLAAAVAKDDGTGIDPGDAAAAAEDASSSLLLEARFACR